MTIQKKLYLMVAVVIGLLIVVVLIQYETGKSLEHERQKKKASHEILLEVNDFVSITYDLIRFSSSRAQRQWQLQYRSIQKVVHNELFQKKDAKPYAMIIEHELSALDEHVNQYLIPHLTLKELVISKDNIISSVVIPQIIHRVRKVEEQAFLIQEKIEVTSLLLIKKRNTFTLVIIILITLFLLIFSTLIIHSITSPLQTLVKDISIIGQGNFNHKLSTERDDEFGQLARSFNTMSENLNKITASRDELNEEIVQRVQSDLERKRLTFELSRKNEELEQIIYATTHDLRSPLVNIQGFGQELDYSIEELIHHCENESIPPEILNKLSPLLKEEIPESLHYIKKSIYKMDVLLAGLLRLSRLGYANVTIVECDMDELIADVISTAGYKINAVAAHVKVSPLPACLGDTGYLGQIFTNLLDNALKYFDLDRQGQISISGIVTNETATYCLADNGIGIDPKHQKNIFNLFHRLNPADSSGEGLGLNLVRRILDKLHGKVWVESEPGVGSQFFIELPAVAKEKEGAE